MTTPLRPSALPVDSGLPLNAAGSPSRHRIPTPPGKRGVSPTVPAVESETNAGQQLTIRLVPEPVAARSSQDGGAIVVARSVRARPSRGLVRTVWKSARAALSGRVLLLSLVALGTPWAPVLLRAASSMTFVSETLAHTSARVVEISADASVVVKDATVTMARVAASLASEAWAGIELGNLKADTVAARWYQAADMGREELMYTAYGESVAELPPLFQQRLWRGLASASARMPLIQEATRSFNATGYYTEYHYPAR